MIVKELDLEQLMPFIPSRMDAGGMAYKALEYHFIDKLSIAKAALKAGCSKQCAYVATNRVYQNIFDKVFG